MAPGVARGAMGVRETGEHDMIAIGIGANSRATQADFAVAIDGMRGLAGGVDVVATVDDLSALDALTMTTADLGIALRALPVAELLQRKEQCLTHSEHAQARYGLPSVAETAALAAAGPSAKLIAPRRIFGGVTAAAAVTHDNREGAGGP